MECGGCRCKRVRRAAIERGSGGQLNEFTTQSPNKGRLVPPTELKVVHLWELQRQSREPCNETAKISAGGWVQEEL